MSRTDDPDQSSPPMFNVPTGVLGTILVLFLVHLIRLALGPAWDESILLRFAFIAARYSSLPLAAEIFPPHDPAQLWTPVTYAFLHADWQHLLVNSAWLLVFGSPVGWRFGTVRFLLFTLLCAVAGAAAQYIGHANDLTPVIGASAGISGLTAAAARFVFEAGGPLSPLREPGARPFLRPAVPFLVSLRDFRVLAFVGLWFAINVLFGTGVVPIGVEDGVVVAWEAHLGGFLAGLLLFPLFDPVPQQISPGDA